MSDSGPLSEHLGYLLHQVDVRLISRIADALLELGLTPGRATAVDFIALDEGCDQMALGRALGINRASTMKVVNSLVTLGLVERRPGRDRRSNALHLTALGAETRLRVQDISGQADAANFSVLTDEERLNLRAMLTKLAEFDPDIRSAATGAGARLRAV